MDVCQLYSIIRLLALQPETCWKDFAVRCVTRD